MPTFQGECEGVGRPGGAGRHWPPPPQSGLAQLWSLAPAPPHSQQRLGYLSGPQGLGLQSG